MKQQRQTTKDPGKARRPTKWDEEGNILPTPLEIEEGKAHRAKDADPADKRKQEVWLSIHFRLWREEGAPCTSRCRACHVVRFGRSHTDKCGFCGI